MKRALAHAGRGAIAVSSLVIFLLLWEVLVRALHVQVIILPPPSAILSELGAQWAWYLSQAWYTFLTTIYGFLLAVVFGIALAVFIVGSTFFESSIYPMVVAMNSVPKVALAPLFVIWLGTDMKPKIAIAFLISIFAIIVDTVHGLRSTPPDVCDLAKVLKCSPLDFFFKVRLPCALPAIFSGMKVAISLALVGAIVGEFVASQQGLGYVILTAQGTFDTTRVFAAIFVLVVMGIGMFGSLAWLEKHATPWHRKT